MALQPSKLFAQEHQIEEDISHAETDHAEEEEFDAGTFILNHIQAGGYLKL